MKEIVSIGNVDELVVPADLTYAACARPREIYREVKFTGEILISTLTDSQFISATTSVNNVQLRRKKYLGI